METVKAPTGVIAPAHHRLWAWPRTPWRQCQRCTVCLLVLLLVMTTGAFAGAFLPVQGPKVPGEYIVVFQPHAPALTHADLLGNIYGAKVAEVWRHVNQARYTHMRAADAQALAQHPAVKFVEENGVVTINTIVTESPVHWNLSRISERELKLSGIYRYSDRADGAGVSVYILDTGIRTSHTDFGGRASVAYDAFSDGRNGQDCNGHGTHVAATVGGRSYGVAKKVRLYSVRVLNCGGSSTWATVIGGIESVTAHHLDNLHGPAVANMSLGGGKSAAVNEAVDISAAAGVVYVVAAGNNNANACNYSPASAAFAITVGASDNTDKKAPFSNWGSCVDLFAPGVRITSAWIGSDTATHTISGTSMAAPHAAGVAAQMLEAHPDWHHAEVAAELTRVATPNALTNILTSPNLLLYVYLPDPP